MRDRFVLQTFHDISHDIFRELKHTSMKEGGCTSAFQDVLFIQHQLSDQQSWIQWKYSDSRSSLPKGLLEFSAPFEWKWNPREEK